MIGEPETFTVQAKTLPECRRRAEQLYGSNIKILRNRAIETDGLFGFFKQPRVELTGYVLPSMFRGAALAKPALDENSEKDKILDKAREHTGLDPRITKVLAEVQGLAEKLDARMPQAARAEHEHITRLDSLMEQNDFLPAFRKNIIAKTKTEIPFDTLNDFSALERQALEWIGESVTVYEKEARVKLPRTLVIVGPTGVGKTTTVAKLATRFAFGAKYGMDRDYRVALITIDRYRIGAEEQLRKYGDILSVPFESACDKPELQRKLSLLSEDADVIIVDTIGKSPRDTVELAEMKEMLDVCGARAEVFLACSATTKALDVVSILKRFETFEYRSVIVTKLDETLRAGNVISALAECGKALSFITDGQSSVPERLHPAKPLMLLTHLEGFELDRARLESHFGV